MRRALTTAVAIALMGGAALSAPAVAADGQRPINPRTADLSASGGPSDLAPQAPLPEVDQLAAGDALTTARRVFSGKARANDPSATLALRDLWVKRSELSGRDLAQAENLLARPTDGPTDPDGFGYTVPEAAPVCNTRICLHYVPTTADAPPSVDWVNQNLAVVDSIWTQEVDQLGYRAPLTDGAKGGGPQLDVYLKDLGGQGIYGYCAPETRVKNRTASGYCVLDNDFSQAQFPSATPADNLLVTAGHEFFHAIQFGYDYAEDRWMMESTATWMEERVATHVNDNRQYFPTSPIYAPQVPLDLFSSQYTFQYGSWVWWEYLSNKYGTGIVKKAWDQAGSLKKDGGKNSVEALQKVLKKKGGFTKNFARFAAGNLTPAANYPEGAEYAFPKFANGKVLTKRKRSKKFGTKIFHLASASYGFAPKGLNGKKWKLAIKVNGPAKRTSPAAVVVVHMKNGKRQVKTVKLNRNGDGRLRVGFNGKKVAVVSVTLVNGSTRYKCNRGTTYACQGKPLDDKMRFSVTGRVTKR
ncbi:MXAN_6640 family putative metalloprotease [Nocardioides hwasunensis]|uniref:Uncharacterized protein n=1 Tax=Nocardioides hwasunensis TaxID=397258 RepID=A0ABR8MIY2_9ACTN|nr:MXAN_6640 family putative metalloprotease [Nocardioides hwasunensis]MBD3915968.1 hypothetical protein [Nocardioides hwasunensis]